MSEDSQLRETRSELSVEWKIKNFFSLPKDPEHYLRSPSFSLSGAKWHLQVYPNGRIDSLGFLSLFFHRNCSSSETNRVAFTLGIQKCDGTTHKSSETEHEYKRNGGYGWPRFLNKEEIRDLNHVLSPDGSLVVFCSVRATTARIVDEIYVEAASQTPSFESVEMIQKHFNDLLLSGRQSDVTCKVSEQEFRAHKLILSARSPVFVPMFDHDMEEKETGTVNIADIDPEHFKDFLSFLYTGKVDMVSSINAVALYMAAEKYDLQDLKNECVRCMTEELSVESICDVIALASMQNEYKLLDTATNFFIENAKPIFLTANWQSLMDENKALANELLVKMANRKL